MFTTNWERNEEMKMRKRKIQRLQEEEIDQHDEEHPLKSFYTKESPGNKGKRPNNDVNNRGTGGDAGGVSASDCAELGKHGSIMR